MAREALASQSPSSSGLNATYTSATVDGHAIDNRDGDVVIHVKNGGGVSTTVTIDVNKTTDGLTIPDKTVSVPAGGERFIGTFRESLYNQDDSGGDTGIEEAVFVNAAPQASVTYAAIKVRASH